MLLSDIFSIPFLICLAICILLIGCSSIYFYQRIMQQDHKISSMVSLISSLTEEESPLKPTSIAGNNPVGNNPVGGNITIDFNPIKNRIQVSDDDSSDGESESGESDGDGESDGVESDGDSDSVLEYSTSSSKCDEILSEIEELNDMNADDLFPEPEPEVLTLSDESIADELIMEQRLDTTTKSIHLESIDFSIFKTINVVGEDPTTTPIIRK